MASCTEVMPDSTREVLQPAALREDQAEAVFAQGRVAVVFALLELTKQLADARGPQVTPSTPSGMIPVYEKPTTKSRKKRPGAKKQDTPAVGDMCRIGSIGGKHTPRRATPTAADA